MSFRSVNGPTLRSSDLLWLHAGDHEAWTICIKATGGLLMNGIALAIAIAMIKLAISSIEQRDHILVGMQHVSTVETLDLLPSRRRFRKMS
jgi:hypothetical protein